MKKTCNCIWLLKPNVNFQKLLLTLKVFTILLFCGLALPAYSLNTENPSGSNTPGTDAVQQQIKVSGTITDATTLLAMPGVNISVKGTTLGAISDENGKFSLSTTEPNATLVFSFIGYVTQVVPLAGKSVIDVVLKAEMLSIDEVVVVGYGTQKRSTVVGSVTSISGASLQAIPAANVTTSLSGRLAGSIFIQNSGEPGQEDARIMIRGRSSLGSTDANTNIASTAPLIVIDGIVGRSMTDIDASDIESLSVLKDASAAIYGAQAANGVIIITTKKGQEGKPRFNYQFFQGFMTPTVLPQVTNAGDYSTMLSEYQDANGRPRSFSDADIALFYSGKDPWKHPNTNWIKDLVKEWTTSSKHTFTLDGGHNGMTYYISLGLKTDESIYKQSSTSYKQYNVRSKIELPITDWLKASINIAGFQINKVYPTKSADAIWGQSTRLVPTQWSFWPNGLPGPDIEYGDNPVVTSTFQTGKDDQKTYKVQSTLGVTITPPFVKGLAIHANYDYDLVNFYRKNFIKPWILYYPNWASATIDPSTGFVTGMDLVPTPRGVSAPQNNEYYQRTINKTANVNFTFNRTFGEHTIGLYGGYEQYENNYNEIWAYRTYYISSAIQTMNAGADLDKNNSGYANLYARKSWIARATYDYKGKYLVEALFRRDGSLKFAPEGRWGNFPGLLLGWRASEEGFWKDNISFINYFKLRASYGMMGMDPGNSFQYLNKYNLDTGLTMGTSKVVETTVVPGNVANAEITWERQITRNIGFDSKILHDLFSLNADFFYNKRDHILNPRDASVPNFTGLTLPSENIARVDNQGFEIEMGFHKRLSSDFNFNVTGNYSYNHNKVIFMDEPARSVDWQVRTGHSYGVSLLYDAIGIFKDQEAVNAYPHWDNAQPGDVIFKDVNNDGVINADDRILVDYTDGPRTFYGVTFDATYKDFSFSVLIQGQGKYLRWNFYDERRGEAGNYYQWNFDDRWTPTNTVTSVARAFNRYDYYWNSGVQNSTYWLDNTAYCRLKSMVLTYNIPSSLYKRLGISRASVFVSGNNIALLYTATKHFDPEIGSAGIYPALKTFAIGGSITF
jgi:TonB-linked SusC/RagA family outer membrane protein